MVNVPYCHDCNNFEFECSCAHEATKSVVATPVPKESQVSILRAMATNYAGGHRWDHLDGRAVTKAADEIEVLRAALTARQDEAVAWTCEMATTIDNSTSPPTYGGWERHLMKQRPCAPSASVRNLTPLYAGASA